MSTWDEHVFDVEANVDFLDELSNLEDDEIVQAIADAVALSTSGQASDEEEENAQAAATIAAIWAGAPFSAGDSVADYPFIRSLVGEGDEELREQAAEILETVEEDYDLEPFLEALS